MSSMSTCEHGRKEIQLSEPFRNSRISDDSLQPGNEEKEGDEEEEVVVQISSDRCRLQSEGWMVER